MFRENIMLFGGKSQINSTAGEMSVNKFYRETVRADTLGQVDQTLSRARVPPRDQLNHKRTYGDQHSSGDRAVMYNSIGFQHCVGECRLHGTLSALQYNGVSRRTTPGVLVENYSPPTPICCLTRVIGGARLSGYYSIKPGTYPSSW